jgi:hypothetical protein
MIKFALEYKFNRVIRLQFQQWKDFSYFSTLNWYQNPWVFIIYSIMMVFFTVVPHKDFITKASIPTASLMCSVHIFSLNLSCNHEALHLCLYDYLL